MSTGFSGSGVVPSAEGDIDPDLLEDAQAFLESRTRGVGPQEQLAGAWDRFYRSYMPVICSLFVTYRLSDEDRDDCAQEVWKEVVVKLGSFRYDPQRGRLSTWLHAIARNKVVDLFRRRRRHFTESLSAEVEGGLYSRDPDPETEFEQRRVQTQVRGVLVELSERVPECNYRVLYLRWIEGRSVPEIATSLGLTPAQVRFRHHRVKQVFRRLIESSDRIAPIGPG